MSRFLFAFLLLSSLFWGACTDTTVVGGDLLDGTQLPLLFTDSLEVELITRRSDTTQTSALQTRGQGVAIGCMEDPFTGKTSSRFGFQIVEKDRKLNPDSLTQVDSIVLVLPILPAYQIGDTTASVSLRVVGAQPGTIDLREALTSDSLLSNGQVYGSITTIPPRQRTTVNTFVNDTLVRVDTVNPQLRIRLNQEFKDRIDLALGNSLRFDSSRSAASDSVFILDFPGLIIEPDGCSSTLPALSLLAGDDPQFGIFIYYKNGAGRSRQFVLATRRSTSNGVTNGVADLRAQYSHDFSGSRAAELLMESNSLKDSLAIVQRLNGLIVRVRLPELDRLNNAVGISLAELEVPVLPQEDPLIRPMPQMIIKVTNNVGDLINYSSLGTDGNLVYSVREGGVLRRVAIEGQQDSVWAYRFNVTGLVQEMVDGTRQPEFFITPVGQDEIPGQSILLGPKTAGLRTRLKLAYTTLP